MAAVFTENRDRLLAGDSGPQQPLFPQPVSGDSHEAASSE